jgi:hypothetical protein
MQPSTSSDVVLSPESGLLDLFWNVVSQLLVLFVLGGLAYAVATGYITVNLSGSAYNASVVWYPHYQAGSEDFAINSTIPGSTGIPKAVEKLTMRHMVKFAFRVNTREFDYINVRDTMAVFAVQRLTKSPVSLTDGYPLRTAQYALGLSDADFSEFGENEKFWIIRNIKADEFHGYGSNAVRMKRDNLIRTLVTKFMEFKLGHPVFTGPSIPEISPKIQRATMDDVLKALY